MIHVIPMTRTRETAVFSQFLGVEQTYFVGINKPLSAVLACSEILTMTTLWTVGYHTWQRQLYPFVSVFAGGDT